jgi:hypothetical protein
MINAIAERFSQNDMTVQILKYVNLHISKIPPRIKFNSSDIKIKGISKATKISILTNSEKE